MGKATETRGDSLTAFVPHLTTQQLQDFLADPRANAAVLLGHATTRIVYDLDRYRATNSPLLRHYPRPRDTRERPAPPGWTQNSGEPGVIPNGSLVAKLKKKFKPSQARLLKVAQASRRAGSEVDGRSSITRGNPSKSTSRFLTTHLPFALTIRSGSAQRYSMIPSRTALWPRCIPITRGRGRLAPMAARDLGCQRHGFDRRPKG